MKTLSTITENRNRKNLQTLDSLAVRHAIWNAWEVDMILWSSWIMDQDRPHIERHTSEKLNQLAYIVSSRHFIILEMGSCTHSDVFESMSAYFRHPSEKMLWVWTGHLSVHLALLSNPEKWLPIVHKNTLTEMAGFPQNPDPKSIGLDRRQWQKVA
jgi:hypothetical protein